MGSKSKTLNDLFLHALKDIFYAERHIAKLFSKLAKATESEALKQAFDQHREETYGQIERLEQIFELVGKKAQGEPCETIQGLVEETKNIIDEFEASAALDAGLIAAAGAVEHYEIARYGSLKTWAAQLGLNQVAVLLEVTLAEQKKALASFDELAGKLNDAPPSPEAVPAEAEAAPAAEASADHHGAAPAQA
jgi:ferritin-like metal-binding protein YciE